MSSSDKVEGKWLLHICEAISLLTPLNNKSADPRFCRRKVFFGDGNNDASHQSGTRHAAVLGMPHIGLVYPVPEVSVRIAKLYHLRYLGHVTCTCRYTYST